MGCIYFSVYYSGFDALHYSIYTRDFLVVFVLESVGDGGSCWLVYHAYDVETADYTSIFGRLSLRVVEVCRDCHDRVLYLLF